MDDFSQRTLADRYTLERELGRGGMATVWLARDLPHARPVAIKILHTELAGAIGVDRFIREVRLAAGLRHPSIVPILDSGALELADGSSLPWYAMAYLEGESLRARLARERQLSIDDALDITASVADSLDAAHRQGIVHRDIKPENIFLADGRVYVIDFGIAKALLATGGERLTSTGLAIGTPAYMSPEQASADAVDARSDQYSLAAVLYEMLTGEPPFSGPTAQAILARRLAEPARPIRTVRPTVPLPLELATLRALQRVPADRFPDMTTFVAALRGGGAHPTRSRRPTLGRFALGVGLLVAAAGVWFVLARKEAAEPRVVSSEVKAIYERGKVAYDRRSPGGTVQAITDFNAAIARDSNYTAAWAGLVDSYARALERGFAIPGLSHDSVLVLAVAAADRMLAADSASAAAWTAEAHLIRQVDPTDVAPSIRAAGRALALDSTRAEAWHFRALGLAESGDMDGALDAWRRDMTLNPRYKQGAAFLSIAHAWRRQFDSAAVWADSAVALDPNDFQARTVAGYSAMERGDTVRAIAAFAAARRLTSDVEVANVLANIALAESRAGRPAEARATLRTADSIGAAYTPVPLHTAVYLAQAYAGLGDANAALAWLTRYQPRRDLHFQLHIRCDPSFAPIVGDPRFQVLLTMPAPPPGHGC